uniref:WH2 domain-containing protein n=1 Tax=Strongyloides papillosus TaxID=174720 RepID=A0A0N5CI18_STREA
MGTKGNVNDFSLMKDRSGYESPGGVETKPTLSVRELTALLNKKNISYGDTNKNLTLGGRRKSTNNVDDTKSLQSNIVNSTKVRDTLKKPIPLPKPPHLSLNKSQNLENKKVASLTPKNQKKTYATEDDLKIFKNNNQQGMLISTIIFILNIYNTFFGKFFLYFSITLLYYNRKNKKKKKEVFLLKYIFGNNV